MGKGGNSQRGKEVFNICVALTSLNKSSDIYHLSYHLTINVCSVYYEPRTVQDTEVRIRNETYPCSPRAYSHHYISVN